MTQFRRLGLLKVKKEKVKVAKVEKYPQLKLMGTRHKELAEGETKKVSHQMKLNASAVKLMNLQKGDKIDIVQGDNTFLIARVSGENEGRTLSANKNTEALSVTFSTAYELLKEVSFGFEVSNDIIIAQNDEEREILGNYNWHILVPREEEGISEKVEEKVDSEEAFS